MRERKSYSKSFKAQVVHECQQPGVSVAAIAMNHGINVSVVCPFSYARCDAQTHTQGWPGFQ
ncbi:hypothetical protein EMIT0196MI5_110190 [Pseudomonas sp. IT-196MI5]|uniref:transposase n=1 Tax=Pseudomonas sp. IT-196MI5 TaxID=3026440 RepID=UPI0039E1D680